MDNRLDKVREVAAARVVEVAKRFPAVSRKRRESFSPTAMEGKKHSLVVTAYFELPAASFPVSLTQNAKR